MGVLLCYNDADILRDSLEHLLANKHDVIAWDHGSSDQTSEILKSYEGRLKEHKLVPRQFDFYNLYPTMSEHLVRYYTNEYDWISWPDQDEILEGPKRDRSYYEYLCQVFKSDANWIQFNNFNYWLTKDDDTSIKSPVRRIRHYSLFLNCAPRIRSWRASATNIRVFNHNPLDGEKYPENFNLRHYPMRTKEQMLTRIKKDRAGLKRGSSNVHYENMAKRLKALEIPPEQLHFDDGGELSHSQLFDWDKIYF